MLYIEQNSKRAPAFKKDISDIYKALISGMTDFAHLNDCILLANFKFKTARIHDTLEVLIDRLLIKLQSAVFYSFHNLVHKSRFPNLVQLWLN